METDERIMRLLRELYEGLLEIDVAADFLDAIPERPLPSILVQAPPDDAGRERVILLAFIPDDGMLEEIDLLQLYMPLPVSREEAAGRMSAANANAALGHAGVLESETEVYWRHVWPLPRGMPIIPQVLLETMQFFIFAAELGTQILAGEE